MLILSRGPEEAIRIGEHTRLVVKEVSGNIVRLGFQADRHVRIVRGELLERDAKRRAQNEARRLTLNREGTNQVPSGVTTTRTGKNP
jgi:carbon storage regulator CsrA